MLCLRIRAGAAVGKIVLPTVASTAPVLIRRKIVGKHHQLFFQVWGRHSWRESANEGLSVSIRSNKKVRATLDRETRPVSSLRVCARLVAQSGSGFPLQGLSSGAYGAWTVESFNGCRQAGIKQGTVLKHDLVICAARGRCNDKSKGG